LQSQHVNLKHVKGMIAKFRVNLQGCN
jgi:hypothetical protein